MSLHHFSRRQSNAIDYLKLKDTCTAAAVYCCIGGEDTNGTVCCVDTDDTRSVVVTVLLSPLRTIISNQTGSYEIHGDIRAFRRSACLRPGPKRADYYCCRSEHTMTLSICVVSILLEPRTVSFTDDNELTFHRRPPWLPCPL